MVPAWRACRPGLAAGPRPALQESLQCPKCCSGKLLCCRKWLSSELTVGSLAAFRGLHSYVSHNFHLTHITIMMADTSKWSLGRDQTKETGLSDGAINSKGCARFWQSIAQFWLCRLHHPDTHGYVWALITACPVHINYDPVSLQCCSVRAASSISSRPRTAALQPKTECDGLDESSGLRLHNPGQTACTGRGLVTTGPAMIAGPGVSDRACAQCHRAESSVSAGEAGDGHWTRTQPAARASSPAQCAVQAAQARVSVTPVSVTHHSPARPQVTQPVTRAQLLRAGQPREIESHSNPLSASSQIWHPPVLRLRRLSIQCVLITEESVRHWLVPCVTGPLVTDCDMWDCEPCDHQHQPRLTL